MKQGTVTIKVPEAEMSEMNGLLSLETMPDSGPYEVVKTYTADFGDGWQADIKVCNGEPPYVDPVLFLDGNEITCIEIADNLNGEYHFHSIDFDLIVDVVAVP
jgi:hypothetical protein